MALTNTEIDRLEDLLFSDSLSDDALDYFGLHGLCCASVVGPSPIPESSLIEIVFADAQDQLSSKDKDLFLASCQQITLSVKSNLLDGKDAELPYLEEEDFEACLESWCIGFMEGFFHNEKSWFIADEEVTAELMLPIMALSGLFDSEEFDAIYKNDKLMSQFAQLIGDQLTDIYLFYHVDKK